MEIFADLQRRLNEEFSHDPWYFGINIGVPHNFLGQQHLDEVGKTRHEQDEDKKRYRKVRLKDEGDGRHPLISTEPVCLMRQFATVSEYEEDFVSGFASDGQAGIRQLLTTRPKWLATRREIELELALGGELWEWETSGYHQMAGAAGLAVIREGKMARKWPLMRS